MTKDDDILINKLFDEIRQMDIPDKDFSHKVMRSLPDKGRSYVQR